MLAARLTNGDEAQLLRTIRDQQLDRAFTTGDIVEIRRLVEQEGVEIAQTRKRNYVRIQQYHGFKLLDICNCV